MMNERELRDRAVITAMEELGIDATDALRAHFNQRHLKIDRYKVLTPEQEEAFQRWLTADSDVARAAAAKGLS